MNKTKVCATCKRRKSVDFFNWKDRDKKLLHYVCQGCHSEYRRRHYLANRKKYIEKARKWNKKQKKELQELLFQYLKEHPCVDCGEKDILVLDFDHRGDKYLEVSKMFRYCYSADKVMKEIRKCDVRCANCHRRRTAKEKKYWRVDYKGP